MNKEQIKKIRESIVKMKKDLGPRQALLILYGSFALSAILIAFFAYRPLIVKLQDADKELQGIKTQLLSQRNNVAALKNLDLEGKLMQQAEVSLAIDEITEKGRALGVKFISITPKELQTLKQANFKKLPINFKIESGYKNLGQILHYLEEFPRTIAEVERLSIEAQEKTLTQLDVEFIVNLYMEVR